MEKLIKSQNGQWILEKAAADGVNKEKGKSEVPHAAQVSAMTKGEVHIAPKPSNPRKGGSGTNELSKEEDSKMMFSDLEQIAHHVEEIRSAMKDSEKAPDWAKAHVTEAAKNLSDVAHYILGKKK